VLSFSICVAKKSRKRGVAFLPDAATNAGTTTLYGPAAAIAPDGSTAGSWAPRHDETYLGTALRLQPVRIAAVSA
jgi:hypothetical protein